MGEEAKKPEAAAAEDQNKMEEKSRPEEENKKEEKKQDEDTKDNNNNNNNPEESKDSKEDSPPPPQEIVLKVYMHCEGCARKVRRCLKGFEGVENVTTDCRTGKVVVKGEKADPMKVLARVQRKSHRQVELLSPLPPPPPPSEPEKKAEEEKPKPEEKKGEPPVVLTVVLKVHMHCEACAMEIKKRIQRMKGVESAVPDLKGSQVTVKGVFEPSKLVEHIYKRTGKHSVIMKIDPPPVDTDPSALEPEEAKKKEEGPEVKGGAEESKGNNGREEKGNTDEEKKETTGDGGGEGGAKDGNSGDADGDGEVEDGKIVEVKKIENPYYYYHGYPPRLAVEMYAYPSQIYAYPPQMFSDENPNACALM